MRGRGVARALQAVMVAELLLSTAVGAKYCGLPRRRSLHQPFFPIDYSPPPSALDDSSVPPPPAALAASGGGRSGSSLTNAVAIALAAGLVALAVAGYSCFLLLRRRSDAGGGGDGPKSLRAGRVASDAGSSDRRHRSPPPSSTASDAIYIDPITTTVEHRQSSPDLRPLALVKQPSPDLRPLPPLKLKAQPPPPAWTPSMTGTGYSSDDDDQETFYTARKTAMSSFSRSTSQRSTMEQAVSQPPAPIPTPAPPPQANFHRPPRPPPPPPPPRQRLLRPMPEESSPPPGLANLALTNSSELHSVQDRGGANPNGNSGGAPQQKPPSLKPLHWDKLRAISGRTTVWDQVNNSDSFRCALLRLVFSSFTTFPSLVLSHEPSGDAVQR
jgi:hypothetical protein